MVISKYNATKIRKETLGYGFIILGYSLLILGIGLYYKTIVYWMPSIILSVMFWIIGLGLIGYKKA